MNVFEIIGPIKIGPSSTQTAGAVQLRKRHHHHPRRQDPPVYQEDLQA